MTIPEISAQIKGLPSYTIAPTTTSMNRGFDADLRGPLKLEAVSQAVALHSSAATAGFEAIRADRRA